MQNRGRFPVGVAALLFAIVALVAACGGDDESAEPTTTAAAAPEPVQIEFLYSPFTDYAPFFVAKDKGYFDDFGVDVKLSVKSGTAETIQLLATGEAEAGGSTWGAGFFNAIELGSTVTVIAQLARMPESGRDPSPLMVSQKAYDAGLKTVADLEGKKVGIPGPGGFGEYSVALALEKGGLTLDDVELVNIGPPDAAAALTNGSIDATWTIEPFRTFLENDKVGRAISEGHAAGVELGFVAFQSKFVEEHEDAVARFTAAYVKAARELDGGGWDDPEIKKIVAKYTELPEDVLAGIGLTVRSEDGALDLDSVREQEEFFRKRGQLEYDGEADIDSVYRRDLLDRGLELLDEQA